MPIENPWVESSIAVDMGAVDDEQWLRRVSADDGDTVPDCQDARFDGDSDVDSIDVAVFQGCMSGANVPADPNCAD